MTPDATAVVTAVRAVLTTQLAWQGTATELLHALAAADGTLALPGNARAMAAHLRGVALLLRESGIEMSFVRSGHVGTRTIHLAQLSAAYAEATQLSVPDVLKQDDAANAQLGVTSPLDSSRSSHSRPLAQPLDAPVTMTQAADANGASLVADANSTSGVLFPSEARITVPLVTAEPVGLQPCHAVGQHTRGIVEDHFAPKRLTLHMCEPRNAVSRTGHRNAMLLLNAVDAAIDALA